jgi:hypothetical protein
MKLTKYIFPVLLFLEIPYVWHGLYSAQFHAYDDNFGILLHCFFVSVLTLLAIVGLTIYKWHLVRQRALIIMCWFLTASPITIFLVVTNYKTVFGSGLAH